MTLTWTDSLALARCLHAQTDLSGLDLTVLDADAVETLIFEKNLIITPMPPGEMRRNTLHSILWHWMRLRDNSDKMCEAG